MTGKWAQDFERILDRIKKSAKVEGQDRLDMVRLIRFTLFALQRSVTGWMEWANNPDIMAQFSLEELKKINKTLAELVCAIVEYDAKITGQTEMGLIKVEDNQPNDRESINKEDSRKKGHILHQVVDHASTYLLLLLDDSNVFSNARARSLVAQYIMGNCTS